MSRGEIMGAEILGNVTAGRTLGDETSVGVG
jgi:hypothetical protein